MTYGRKEALAPDGTKKWVGKCGWEKAWEGEPDGSSGRLSGMRKDEGAEGKGVGEC